MLFEERLAAFYKLYQTPFKKLVCIPRFFFDSPSNSHYN